ncbi:hypothetical protein OPV22_001691 [Ensete ventricosum]|uniref:Uncharacterized protein n=1 Tax=Ensete ventricosum TaxID=4639 RepID=A0AAV8RQP4_ENSVE|nr:hypothetical protein OPV22_001691 [Ensete ventricosum]
MFVGQEGEEMGSEADAEGNKQQKQQQKRKGASFLRSGIGDRSAGGRIFLGCLSPFWRSIAGRVHRLARKEKTRSSWSKDRTISNF